MVPSPAIPRWSREAGGRFLRLTAVVAGLAACAYAVVGCGSSTSTATSPSTITRCAVTLGTVDATIPADGGAGRLTVTTARECQWTASSENSWLSISGSASGQGDGAVDFVVAANPDPVTRRGSLALNGEHAQVNQAAGTCAMTLSQSSASFPPVGGSGSVDMRASSSLCNWSASSDAGWLVIRSGTTGRGNGTIAFDVQATTGPPRVGNITAGGLQFSVTQSEGCTYSASPASHSVPAPGGSGAVTVTTGAGCPWLAASNVDWISIAEGATGMGPGAARFVVSPTGGPTRTGTLLVGGQTITVTQSPGCAFDVAPLTHTIPAAGGSASVTVSTSSTCVWSASADVPWLSITGAKSGSGSATVSFLAAANDGGARSGTLTVAGRTVTVSQPAACNVAISPDNQSVPASGGTGSVAVTAAAGCTWTATSNANWIQVTSGSPGSGNGTVRFTAAATTAGPRSGTLTIGGQTFTVNQGSGCTFTLDATETTVPASGGTRTISVDTSNGCAWSSSTTEPWISITSGTAGTDDGKVTINVAANSGPARNGVVTIAGHTYTVHQDPGCSVTINPTTQSIAAGGGTTSFAVTAPNGCTWTARPDDAWIDLGSGSTGNGSGNGTVPLVIAANNGAARTGTVTVSGLTFTVNQASGCTYSVAPTSRNEGGGGGNGTFNVNTSASNCPWTAVSNVSWIRITDGASGTGGGKVDYAVDRNTGAARTGTITVMGQVFTVNQQ
jgi:all-beta uncharacterized protein/BACON domain-containing protein